MPKPLFVRPSGGCAVTIYHGGIGAENQWSVVTNDDEFHKLIHLEGFDKWVSYDEALSNLMSFVEKYNLIEMENKKFYG